MQYPCTSFSNIKPHSAISASPISLSSETTKPNWSIQKDIQLMFSVQDVLDNVLRPEDMNTGGVAEDENAGGKEA